MEITYNVKCERTCMFSVDLKCKIKCNDIILFLTWLKQLSEITLMVFLALIVQLFLICNLKVLTMFLMYNLGTVPIRFPFFCLLL